MSEPHRHHWLSQFLPRPWCGSDGLVTSFYRRRDKVLWSRRSLKSLGWQQNLYSVEWSGFRDPQFIEKCMSWGFEGPAAAVRDRLLQGDVDHLSQRERHAFATFLVLLLVRQTEIILPKQEWLEARWQQTIDEMLVDRAGKRLTLPPLKADYARSRLAGYGRDCLLRAMLEYAHDSQLTHEMRKLQWRVYTMVDGSSDLVISDRPIRMWGHKGILHHLMLPISPRALFVAGVPSYFADAIALRDEFRSILPIDVIGDQFRQARRFVIARDLGPNNAFPVIAEENMVMSEDSNTMKDNA